MNRPTPKQLTSARELLIDGLAGLDGKVTLSADEVDAVWVLLAATEVPTDEEIYHLVRLDVDHDEDSYVFGWLDALRHFFGPVKP